MKLLSTEIGENYVELIYADNSEIDDAETLLIWRLPTETHHGKSVALNRYAALKALQKFIREQMEADEAISNGWNR
jgi:hypothetical protein